MEAAAESEASKCEALPQVQAQCPHSYSNLAPTASTEAEARRSGKDRHVTSVSGDSLCIEQNIVSRAEVP